MHCECFAPIASEQARVLIVGSMPSVKSLEDAEYYAHPRNAFWPILFEVFGEEPTRDYEVKKRLILRHDLALWDAACSCEREGSLDSAMKAISFNDFEQLFARCPQIHTVLCNGGTAHQLFQKSGFGAGKTVLRLPSTSPAYTLAFQKKLEAWRAALLKALS